jgi:hypothetical protein
MEGRTPTPRNTMSHAVDDSSASGMLKSFTNAEKSSRCHTGTRKEEEVASIAGNRTTRTPRDDTYQHAALSLVASIVLEDAANVVVVRPDSVRHCTYIHTQDTCCARAGQRAASAHTSQTDAAPQHDAPCMSPRSRSKAAQTSLTPSTRCHSATKPARRRCTTPPQASTVGDDATQRRGSTTHHARAVRTCARVCVVCVVCVCGCEDAVPAACTPCGKGHPPTWT